MEYSALIFDDCMDETDSYENLEASVQVFQKDDRRQLQYRLAFETGAKTIT